MKRRRFGVHREILIAQDQRCVEQNKRDWSQTHLLIEMVPFSYLSYCLYRVVRHFGKACVFRGTNGIPWKKSPIVCSPSNFSRKNSRLPVFHVSFLQQLLFALRFGFLYGVMQHGSFLFSWSGCGSFSPTTNLAFQVRSGRLIRQCRRETFGMDALSVAVHSNHRRLIRF